MVEHRLAKARVAGSNPVSRSNFFKAFCDGIAGGFFVTPGSPSSLQTRTPPGEPLLLSVMLSKIASGKAKASRCRRPVWRLKRKSPVVPWSVKLHPDFPLLNLRFRPNWSRPDNMGPDVTISGGHGKVQQGLVLDGAWCDELAAVIAHISHIAGTPEWERGIHA